MGYGNGESGGMAISGLAKAYDAARATQPAQPSVISEQMHVLDKMTEQMHGLISELEARIRPTGDKPGIAVGHGPAPIGSLLGQMNDRLQAAANRLRNIIERVEL